MRDGIGMYRQLRSVIKMINGRTDQTSKLSITLESRGWLEKIYKYSIPSKNIINGGDHFVKYARGYKYLHIL